MIFSAPHGIGESAICLGVILLIYLLGYLVWQFLGEEEFKSHFTTLNHNQRRDAFVISWSILSLMLSILFGDRCAIFPLIAISIALSLRLFLKRKAA